MKDREIRVPVRGGYLVAGRNVDPNYDGIYVIFEDCDGYVYEIVNVTSSSEKEYATTDVYCYEDPNSENFTRKFSIDNEDYYENDKGV